MGAVLSNSGWQLSVFCLGLAFAALAVVRAALWCASLMIPKFKIGQSVVYLPTSRWKGIGRWDGQAHYRIRSNDDPSREYTAEAKELRRATM
jgi:hypothetical protein